MNMSRCRRSHQHQKGMVSLMVALHLVVGDNNKTMARMIVGGLEVPCRRRIHCGIEGNDDK